MITPTLQFFKAVIGGAVIGGLRVVQKEVGEYRTKRTFSHFFYILPNPYSYLCKVIDIRQCTQTNDYP